MQVKVLVLQTEEQRQEWRDLMTRLMDFQARLILVDILGGLENREILDQINHELEIIEAELDKFAMHLDGQPLQ